MGCELRACRRVIGGSEACIATHPSDMAISMRVLNAVMETVNAEGETRAIPLADFHLLPDNIPHIETVLAPDEFITAVIIPRPLGGQHFYHKVRDPASYAIALVSIAGVIHQDGSSRITAVALLATLATIPWIIIPCRSASHRPFKRHGAPSRL